MEYRSKLFRCFGDCISPKNKTELKNTLEKIDFKVPLRTEGRKIIDRERWCFRFYLSSPLTVDKFIFPLKIRKNEAPDLIIEHGDGTVVGVEHTEATIPKYQEHLTQGEKLYDLNKKTEEEIVKDQSEHGPSFRPEGWAGDQNIEVASTLISEAVLHKTIDLQKYNLKPDRIEELLVYHNSDAPMDTNNSIPETLSLSTKKIDDLVKQYPINFDAIYIIMEPELFQV